jgi:hypothetical protein
MAVLVCAATLWGALHRQWDAYGALQLPLLFEAACACVIAVAATSPLGEPERVAGRRLPWLRLGTATGLTLVAAMALMGTGIGTHLAGGGLSAVSCAPRCSEVHWRGPVRPRT